MLLAQGSLGAQNLNRISQNLDKVIQEHMQKRSIPRLTTCFIQGGARLLRKILWLRRP